MGYKEQITDLRKVLEEAENYAKKYKYMGENDRLSNFSSVKIETLIGQIESRLQLATYMNYFIVPITVVFSAAIAIMVSNPKGLQEIQKIVIAAGTFTITGGAMFLGFKSQTDSKKSVYLKHLLEIYLKYTRSDISHKVRE